MGMTSKCLLKCHSQLLQCHEAFHSKNNAALSVEIMLLVVEKCVETQDQMKDPIQLEQISEKQNRD